MVPNRPPLDQRVLDVMLPQVREEVMTQRARIAQQVGQSPMEGLYKKVFPQGYATEHINPYTRRELRHELERLGLVVMDVQYVFGSEMIFRASKPPEPAEGSAERPLAGPRLRIAGR